MKTLFGVRFKEARREKNLSQKDIATIFKVSHTTIYHWENGKQQPSIEMLMDIALFFGVSLDYLTGLIDY